MLLLLFIFVSALPSPVALAGCIVSGAALAALLVLNWNNARKVRAAHEEKRGVLEQALRDARSDAAAQQKLYDAAARELLVLIPAGDISRVGAYLDAALQKYHRGKPIPIYGESILLPKTKAALVRVAQMLGVSHSALLIQLRKYKLLEQHDVTEYISGHLAKGGGIP